jgi:hypothetical protein
MPPSRSALTARMYHARTSQSPRRRRRRGSRPGENAKLVAPAAPTPSSAVARPREEGAAGAASFQIKLQHRQVVRRSTPGWQDSVEFGPRTVNRITSARRPRSPANASRRKAAARTITALYADFFRFFGKKRSDSIGLGLPGPQPESRWRSDRVLRRRNEDGERAMQGGAKKQPAKGRDSVDRCLRRLASLLSGGLKFL